QDLQPVGFATNAPYRVNVQLPTSGKTTVRAIATDRFNNDGPVAELLVTVVSNQPPSVVLLRGNPSTGALGNGQTFTVLLSAADDVQVTNVTLVGVGVLQFVTNFPSGAQRALTFTVPP